MRYLGEDGSQIDVQASNVDFVMRSRSLASGLNPEADANWSPWKYWFGRDDQPAMARDPENPEQTMSLRWPEEHRSAVPFVPAEFLDDPDRGQYSEAAELDHPQQAIGRLHRNPAAALGSKLG